MLDSGTAIALLVIGSAGMGKSRLRRELERMLDDAGRTVHVLSARADAVGQSSALSLLTEALRHRARRNASERSGPRVDEGAPIDERRRGVERLAREAFEGAAADEAVPFLGELLGVPMEETTELKAAREDPRLMADRLRMLLREYLEGVESETPPRSSLRTSSGPTPRRSRSSKRRWIA